MRNELKPNSFLPKKAPHNPTTSRIFSNYQVMMGPKLLTLVFVTILYLFTSILFIKAQGISSESFFNHLYQKAPESDQKYYSKHRFRN